MNTADHAGDWDLTPFFPGLDSPAYNGFIDALGRDLGACACPARRRSTIRPSRQR